MREACVPSIDKIEQFSIHHCKLTRDTFNIEATRERYEINEVVHVRMNDVHTRPHPAERTRQYVCLDRFGMIALGHRSA